MAEHLPGNLDEIRDWLAEEPTAHSWTEFMRYTLHCEGVVPTPKACQHRIALTRAKTTHLLPFDLRRERPLGHAASYSTFISAFRADSATGDIREWSLFMDRIAALVRTGGSLMIAALHDATSYRIGNHHFPSAKVLEDDLYRQTLRAFPGGNVTVTCCPVPDKGRGYRGVLLAHGWVDCECSALA